MNKTVVIWVICLCCGGPSRVLARPLLSDESHGLQRGLRQYNRPLDAQVGRLTDLRDGSRLSHWVRARQYSAAEDAMSIARQRVSGMEIDVQRSAQSTRRLLWQGSSRELLQLLQSQAAATSASSTSLLQSRDSSSSGVRQNSRLLHAYLQRRLQQSAGFDDSNKTAQDTTLPPELQQSCTCSCSNSTDSSNMQTDDKSGPATPSVEPTDSSDSSQLSSELAAASGGAEATGLDESSSGDVLLMGVKIAPVPAALLLERLATGDSSGTDLGLSFAADAAAAAASSLNVSADSISVSLQSRLTLALQLPNSLAAAGSSDSSSSSRVAGSLDVLSAHLAHDYIATQAVAEFLEETAGPTSVLVSVNLVQLRSAVKDGSSSSSRASSSDGVTIALTDITALGDLSQTVAAAAAMVGNCPELFDRGVSLNMSPGDDDITRDVTNGSNKKNNNKSNTDDSDADGDGLWSAETGCGKLLWKSYQAVLGSSSSDSSGNSRDGSNAEDLDVTVILPLEVNFKLKIMVKIPAGKDSQQLAAAAAAWLQSQHVEQLLQQHGLHAGLGSPARLTTVLPHKVTVATPDVTTFSNSNHTADANSWKRESATAVTVGSSDSSKNRTLDVAMELQTAAAAAADQPRVISETAPQLVLIVVITVAGSATVGAAAAAAIAWHWRKKRQLRGRSAAKGGSSSARRRRRTRGIMKRHSKYLPAGCNMPPGADAAALLPLPVAATTTPADPAAAGNPDLSQQVAGSHSVDQQQQQQQLGLPADAELATAPAAAASGATDGAAVAAGQPISASSSSQQPSRIVFNPTRLVLPRHSTLFHTHSAPVAAVPAALQRAAAAADALPDHGGSSQAPAAGSQPVSRLRRYWSYAQGLSGHRSVDGSTGDTLILSRSDLCSDSVSSAVRYDLQQQQQQQEGPALSRSSSRSTRSTISSSSFGEHDDLGPHHMLEPGRFLHDYRSSGDSSSSDDGTGINTGSSSSRGQVLAYAASLEHSGVGISPFQSHYNFGALSG